MDAIFGKPEDAKDVIRDQQRQLRSVTRDLDRDRALLAKEEKDLQIKIKMAAKDGNVTQAKMLAKHLVRVRQQQEKNLNVKSQITGVSHKVTTIQSQQVLAKGIGQATKAMAVGNKAMNLPQLQQTTNEFARENQRMEMAQEMFDDTIDELDESEDEEESENVMNQILEEIGIDATSGLKSAPSKSLPSKTQVSNSKQKQLLDEDDGNDDLMARLEALKRS